MSELKSYALYLFLRLHKKNTQVLAEFEELYFDMDSDIEVMYDMIKCNHPDVIEEFEDDVKAFIGE